MKILKEGNYVDARRWKLNIKCTTRKAQLEIMKSDLQKRQRSEGMQWDTYPVGYTVVVCPECGSDTEVKPPSFKPSRSM